MHRLEACRQQGALSFPASTTCAPAAGCCRHAPTMLDYFAIFTKGGALLWTLQFTTALKHSPLEALNALIRTCLLEERSGDSAFSYAPKAGAAQALKWTFHNVSRPAAGGSSSSAAACAVAAAATLQRAATPHATPPARCSCLPPQPPCLPLRPPPQPPRINRITGPGPRVCGRVPAGAAAAVR